MRGLTRADRNRMNMVVLHLRSGNEAAGKREWQAMFTDISRRGSARSVDVNALVQHVLRQSYVETNRDLRAHAEKVRYYNELKETIRSHTADVRRQMSQWQKQQKSSRPGARLQSRTIRVMQVPKTVTLPLRVSYTGKPFTTASELEAYLEEWEDELQDIGDDAQLSNIDLESQLQKQQQTLQTMSNVSKMLHDMAMAIIRKIG